MKISLPSSSVSMETLELRGILGGASNNWESLVSDNRRLNLFYQRESHVFIPLHLAFSGKYDLSSISNVAPNAGYIEYGHKHGWMI